MAVVATRTWTTGRADPVLVVRGGVGFELMWSVERGNVLYD
jgi:hypothetical protein